MDRHLHVKYYPEAPRHVGLPDQMMWPVKDTKKYTAYNGISHPIYSCNGNINYTLPLEMYPPENDVHPQIKWQQRMHMPYRGPGQVVDIPPTLQDYHMAGIPARHGFEGPRENFQLPGRDTGRTMHSGSTGRRRHGPLDDISRDMSEGRVEGFYERGPYFRVNHGGALGSNKFGKLNSLVPGDHMKPGEQGPTHSGFIKATMRTEPGMLPDPSGYAAGCSACTGCPTR